MNRKTRVLLLLFICITLALTSGCWDYKEIVEKIIIAGAAVDYDSENDGILLTVEIALPMPSEKQSVFQSKIYQGKGKNMVDAAKDLTSRAGHKLLWSHSKLLILSSEIMEKEHLFIGIMDWIKREHETRDYMWLLFSKEKTASEIFLKSNPQTEDIVSYYLDHLFLTMKDNETYLKVSYWRFMHDMQSVSTSVALPTVRLEDSSNGTLPFLNGTEIFDGTKQVCWLDGNQTKILLLLMNRLDNAVFALKQPDDEKSQIVSLKIIKNKTSIKPVLHEKGLSMKVDVEMEANINEVDGSKDILKPDGFKTFEKEAQNMITDQIDSIINLLKEKYRIDIIGFGNKVENKYPKVWKLIGNNWKEEFAQIPSEIQLKLNITGSEQGMKITKVGK